MTGKEAFNVGLHLLKLLQTNDEKITNLLRDTTGKDAHGGYVMTNADSYMTQLQDSEKAAESQHAELQVEVEKMKAFAQGIIGGVAQEESAGVTTTETAATEAVQGDGVVSQPAAAFLQRHRLRVNRQQIR